MAVYPFYVESKPTGTRKSPIAGGCRNKDGSQETFIYQREHGEIITAFKVVQTSSVDENGERILTCEVYNRSGDKVAEETTIY